MDANTEFPFLFAAVSEKQKQLQSYMYQIHASEIPFGQVKILLNLSSEVLYEPLNPKKI